MGIEQASIYVNKIIGGYLAALDMTSSFAIAINYAIDLRKCCHFEQRLDSRYEKSPADLTTYA